MMMLEKEFIMLLAGAGTCVYLIFSRDAVSVIPGGRLLLAGFFLTFSGWFFTFSKSCLSFQLSNIFEFIGYTGGAVCVSVWCFRTLPHRNHEEHVHVYHDR
jgi:hypothetical protein